MAYKITSTEWVAELQRQLNRSEAYERAAKDYVGTVIFSVQPDEGFVGSAHMYLKIVNGKCIESGKVADPKDIETVMIVYARYGVWRKIIEGRLDPIQGVMMRQLRIEGDILRLMRYPKAAKEMIACGLKVPTDFETGS
jgi:putative sterol carrier protein